MKFADAVLLAIPLFYLFTAASLAPLDATGIDALLVGSIAAGVTVLTALFINPPR